MHDKHKGFHLIEIIIAIAVIGLIGFIAYMFVNNAAKDNSSLTVKTSDGGTKQAVRWEYNEKSLEWFAKSGTPPACDDPYKFAVTPLDMSKVMVTGLPGAYRGFSYKPHGGFRLYENSNGEAEIKLPTDATLVGLTRYYEATPGNSAELQYLLTFETDCGIAFRFDHLHTLTPKFQAIANTTPEPKLNDTRTNPNDAPEPVAFKAGEIVATKVGFMKSRNYGFDFGVYDYRERNEISKNTKWAEIHQQYSSLDYHGVCWFNMLPGGDAAKSTQLSEITINPQRPNLVISDYCSNAKYSTLDFNNGQPIDG